MRNYQLKASGPLNDRLDFIMSLRSTVIQDDGAGETSKAIRERTTSARKQQRLRYNGKYLNGNAPAKLVFDSCLATPEQMETINKACYENKWSNRPQLKLIRITRTISDLAGIEGHTDESIEFAVHYRKLMPTAGDANVAEEGVEMKIFEEQ